MLTEEFECLIAVAGLVVVLLIVVALQPTEYQKSLTEVTGAARP